MDFLDGEVAVVDSTTVLLLDCGAILAGLDGLLVVVLVDFSKHISVLHCDVLGE